MNPIERNTSELERLREMTERGEPIDWQKEVALAEIDDAIAEAYYTQQAIDRVKVADDELERRVNA